ncbi:MAG: hypothetical protein U0936_27940 [Planctomycetaceae bacterium]
MPIPLFFVSALDIYHTPHNPGSVYGFKLSSLPPRQNVVPYFQNQKIVPLFGEQDFGYSMMSSAGGPRGFSALVVGDPVTRESEHLCAGSSSNWIPTGIPITNATSSGFGSSVAIGSDSMVLHS